MDAARLQALDIAGVSAFVSLRAYLFCVRN